MHDLTDDAGDDPTLDLRCLALTHAVDLHRATYRPDHTGAFGPTGVVRTATRLLTRFLDPPVTAELTFEPAPIRTEGETVAQFHVDTPGPIVARVVLRDRRGNEIPNDPSTNLDDVRFSVNPEGPVSLTDRGDGRSVELVLNTVGDTLFTATVDTATGPREVQEALQIIPGEVATMEISFDVPPAPEPGV